MKKIHLCVLAAGFVCFSGAAGAEDGMALNLKSLAAVRNGNLPALQETLYHGASIDTRNRIGDSLLMSAIRTKHGDIAAYLISRGANVNLADAAQATPLMAAAFAGDAATARLLLAKKADPQAQDRLHKTAMVYAAGTGHADVVALLLDSGIDANARYANDLTALMWCAAYGHLDTARLLLQHGANPGLMDNRGKSALDIARENGQPAMAALLQAVTPK